MADFPAVIQLADIDGSNGFRIDGNIFNGQFGYQISAIGDVNHDGIADFIVSAPFVSGNGSSSGSAWVVFGTTGGFPAGLDLTTLTGHTGFRINGAGPGDDLGLGLGGGGNFNGDGIDDIVVGSIYADPHGTNSGAAYVIFGQSGDFPAAINLNSLSSTQGFTLNGVAANDRVGEAARFAGDINGDGYDDIVIGARFGDGTAANTGAAYVVFGHAGASFSTVELSALNGTNGFVISGAQLNEGAGWSAASAGDFNGDGYDDLIIGGYANDHNAFDSGAAYIVFGKAGGFSPMLNLANLDGANGFALYGSAGAERAGRSVSSAGDVNGDGYDDVIIGGPGKNGAYVLFGGPGGFAASKQLSSLNGTDGFRLVAPTGQTGSAVSSAGDINGDGFDDLIIGANYASPNGTLSGSAYVVFGHAGAFASTIDLTTLNGADGFRLDGVHAYDHAGHAVSSVGDINHDGFDDFAVTSRVANLGAIRSAGQTFIVYGHANSATPVRWTGGAGVDSHTGSGQRDIMSGGSGNDTLSGLGGDDTLNGDDGNDRLYGGDGSDQLNGGLGADQLFGGDGIDTLNGGDGNDTLDGGAGADAMTGGTGNDIYYVDDANDQTIELPGEGVDIVRASLSWTLGANVDQLELQGTGAFNGTGNELANRLTGNSGDNVLSGLAGVDTILGGDGNDTIIGGTGNDLMTGGAGADTFVVLQESVYWTKSPGGRTLETDFVSDLNKAEGDRLDLSAIDADATTAGDQAFHLVSAFSKHGGEMTLAYSASANQTVLSLDVDGDGKADYQMKIAGDVHADSGGWIL